ncbi:DUF4381 domain-containing protein [Photobacterium gaetbulicola]|uniref:DUF4381 domain-containing protein n=1 Tax=Photobacterium gaetbulicola Gung47 TaxID=658445 RepID=A0A0C5WB30_9GAMM|nr:DUF4381 domain-containing protein [Photobacterium gaetbulicola]AJR08791.1 hypothetical protein H744_2c2127 [Photobacterium gaetbulicola Gung47]PSU10421.1 DUF4381 domain-containing protein [Photobacterium gaetbulicola]
MSIEHSPPSTYILRELHDVTVPESVSWMPQTIGWKVLLVLLCVIAGYLCYRRLVRWWHNRYRAEARTAITRLPMHRGLEGSADSGAFDGALFSILKIVLVYLEPANAKLFGHAFLQKLDELGNGRVTFKDELGTRWVQSLVDPSITLGREEQALLREKALCWIREHEGRSITKHVSLRAALAKLLNGNKKQGEGHHV